jgi:hypothetical protein
MNEKRRKIWVDPFFFFFRGNERKPLRKLLTQVRQQLQEHHRG